MRCDEPHCGRRRDLFSRVTRRPRRYFLPSCYFRCLTHTSRGSLLVERRTLYHTHPLKCNREFQANENDSRNPLHVLFGLQLSLPSVITLMATCIASVGVVNCAASKRLGDASDEIVSLAQSKRSALTRRRTLEAAGRREKLLGSDGQPAGLMAFSLSFSFSFPSAW